MEWDDYFSEPFDKTHAWIDLLLLAKYKPCYTFVRGVKIRLEVGQVCVSIRELAKRWRWSEKRVRGFLIHLENEGMVGTQKSNVTTIVSVLNYEFYQKTSAQTSAQILDEKGTQKGTQKKDLTHSNSVCKNEVLKKTSAQTSAQILDEKGTLYINNKRIYNKENIPKGISKKRASSSVVSDETTSTRSKKIDYEIFRDLWNEVCVSLPKVRILGNERKEKIRMRLSEFEGDSFDEKVAFVKMLFEKVENSDFCRGLIVRQYRPIWRATFDWFFRNSTNWVKVLEGNFDNEIKDNEKYKDSKRLDRRGMDSKAETAEEYYQRFTD